MFTVIRLSIDFYFISSAIFTIFMHFLALHITSKYGKYLYEQNRE